MRGFYIFFILFFHLLISAQDSAFYFSSKVCDQSTGKGIPYACINLKSSFRKTFSDSKGVFSILINKKNSILEICADGYETCFLTFPRCLSPENKINIIPLNRPRKMVSNAWQKVYRNGKWIVLNYAFCNTDILLIALNKSTETHSLILIDSTGTVKHIKCFQESISSFYNGQNGEFFLFGIENVYSLLIENNEIKIINSINFLDFQKNNFGKPYADSSGAYVCYESEPEFFLNDEVGFMARKKYSTWYVRLKKNDRLSLFKNFTDDKFLKSPGNWKRAADLGMPELAHSLGYVNYPGSPLEFLKWKDQLIVVDLFNYHIENFDNMGKFLNGYDFYRSKDTFNFKKILMDIFYQELYFLGISETNFANYGSNEYFKKIQPLTGQVTTVELPDKDHFQSMKIYKGYQYFLLQEGNEQFLVRTKL